MKKMLGAAVAAVVLACAGSAGASTVLYEKSGTSSMETTHIIPLPGLGRYRAEIITSSDAYMVATLFWTVHWDIFIAPPPRPHSEYIEGNSYDTSGAGEWGVTSHLIFDFVMDETYRYFNASAAYETLYGIAEGTPLYEWTRPEEIGLLLDFDNDYGEGPELAYTFRITQISAVPEPATWAMMIAGFGLAGSVLRRRRGPLLARQAGNAVVRAA